MFEEDVTNVTNEINEPQRNVNDTKECNDECKVIDNESKSDESWSFEQIKTKLTMPIHVTSK